MNKEIEKLVGNAKVLVLDFDATIVDSLLFHYQAYVEFLKENNLWKNEDEARKIISIYFGENLSDSAALSRMKSEYTDIKTNVKDFVKWKNNKVTQFLIKQKIQPYTYISQLTQFNKPIYILSANIEESITKYLEFAKIKDDFYKVYSAEDMNLLKTDFYADTKKWFNEEPKDVLLFDDSIACLKGAVKNGLKTVGIVNNFNKKELDVLPLDAIINPRTTGPKPRI